MIAGKQLGRIGLGCVTFGREIDRLASFVMMDHAVKNGIYFFDTAAIYGAGASEEIVGEWLRANNSVASKLSIATKILPPYDVHSISKSVDACRLRLGIDTIDLMFLHKWDEAILSRKTLTALDNLINSGAVCTLGASNFLPQQLEQAVTTQRNLQLTPFSFAQNNHNYAVRDYDHSFQQICKNLGVEMITYSPLGAGFLTGKHRQGITSGSRFEVIPGHQKVYFNEESNSRLQRLLSVAAKWKYDPVQLALAWAFHQPAAMVLVGGRKPAHLDQALKALQFNNETVLKELNG